MQIKRRRRAARGLIAVGAAIGTMCLSVIGSTAAKADVTQGVPAPYVTTANGSDAHTKPCVHNGQHGICLFTSQDLKQGPVQTGYPTTPGGENFYPMDTTLGYFSTDGINWSGPTVLMKESTYQAKGWVQTKLSDGTPFNPLHLWAPSAQQGSDGKWYLYVPDISDSMAPATSSFVGVSQASDPMGPYTPIKKMLIPGYASDPDVVDTTSGPSGTAPVLAWADGDGTNCGGISVVPLNGDMTDLNANPVHPVFDGIPSTFGSTCTDGFGRTHLYMEGPHIYNTTLGGAAGNWPAGVPGPYLILMCGSASNEFTDQGSIMPVTSHGHTALILVYHDGPGADSTGHNRTLHAECLLWDAADTHGGGSGPGFNGNIAQSIRTAGTQFTDSGAEANCLTSFDSTSVALRSPGTSTQPAMFISGNGLLTADRYDAGPWEKFRMMQNGVPLQATFADPGSPQRTNGVSILAEANNMFLTDLGVASCLESISTTVSGPGQLFDFIPSYSSGAGETFFHAELTGNGEKALFPAPWVCENGDAATPWFVYHY